MDADVARKRAKVREKERENEKMGEEQRVVRV